MKRRSLVLTDEAARHPFRATLPPSIRASGKAALAEASQGSLWSDMGRGELDFALAVFISTFVAVSLYIA